MMVCPTCDGNGGWLTETTPTRWIDCQQCYDPGSDLYGAVFAGSGDAVAEEDTP